MAERSDATKHYAVRDAEPAYRAATVNAAPDDAPPGYKRTEVGQIPEHWHVGRLDSVGRGSAVKAGPFGSSLTKASYSQSGFKVYGQEQVIRGDYLYGDYFISEAKYHQLRSCSVRPGDILISLVGTAGKALLIPEGAPEGIINPRLVRVRLNEAQVDSLFFKYLIESAQIQSTLIGDAQGGTMDVLNTSILRALYLPVPPVPEQRAIAAVLSDADALIESLDRLIAKNRAIKQAAMQQLLTGETRLPGFDGEWCRTHLGDVLNHVVGGGTPSRSNPNYWNGHIPWATVKDFVLFDPYETQETITEEGLADSATNLIPAGTLIISTRIALSKAVIYKVNASINQDLKGLFFNESAIPRYFYYWFHHYEDTINDFGSGSTVKGLSVIDLKALPLQLPPVDEQAAIATVLSDMDAEIEALERRRDKARQIKQGMMQQLLTGRVRLVAPEAVA